MKLYNFSYYLKRIRLTFNKNILLKLMVYNNNNNNNNNSNGSNPVEQLEQVCELL